MICIFQTPFLLFFLHSALFCLVLAEYMATEPVNERVWIHCPDGYENH